MVGVMAMTVKSAADIVWDGIAMPGFDHCLSVSIFANDIKAIGRAKEWASSFDELPEGALLRVTVNGSIRYFAANYRGGAAGSVARSCD